MILKNCNRQEFIRRLNGRKVICFGAGALMVQDVYLRRGTILNLESHIAFFADNNAKKHRKVMPYGGKEFPIFGPVCLDEIEPSGYVLLITCMDAVSVYQQLDKNPNLGHLECYFYMAVLHNPTLDLDQFLIVEAMKYNYAHYRAFLESLNLKGKHRGERCFIIGNGPSLRMEDLDLLTNEVTFAANRIYLAFDKTEWRPTYYMCNDLIGYLHDHSIIHQLNGITHKFTTHRNAVYCGRVYEDMVYLPTSFQRVDEAVDYNTIPDDPGFSFEVIDGVVVAQTVLYTCLQVAVYMGFSEIYLLGTDCNFVLEQDASGKKVVNHELGQSYFDSKYSTGFDIIPVEVYRTINVWKAGKRACEEKGIVIKNATRGGKLEVFERVSFDELMKGKK